MSSLWIYFVPYLEVDMAQDFLKWDDEESEEENESDDEDESEEEGDE